ncbi:uncharacterized protein LOC123980899 isoform X3 [Micropterus dolomieu]|uniref:uncharacterized protein LOC123980899 isoform X3 n=1 Tax=Micropterus dolomieu TaxID=147949 RepID=UPI001E8EC785|nr:uncharacterized protein LOC123980899 isoform X3 [Micropterus dolomieu]
METVNVLFVSSVDSVDYKLSKTEILRGFIAEKLTTAAQEIFAVVERTVAGYEEEASGLRQEIDRQRRQLEAVLQPRVSLCRTGHQFPVCEPAAGGAAELPAEEEQHRSEQNVEDSGSRDILGQAEEEEGEDEEEESAEETVQRTSLDEEDLGNPDHQITNTRSQSVKRKHRRRSHLDLRVDSQSTKRAGRRLTFNTPEAPREHGLSQRPVSASPPTDDKLLAAISGLSRQLTQFIADASQQFSALNARMLPMEERMAVLESNNCSGVDERKRKRRVKNPKIAEAVRRLHNSEANCRRYDAEQGLCSPSNEAVTSHLVEALQASPDLQAACKTHYETVRRNFRYSQPDLADKATAIKSSARCRSRRKRLLAARQSVLAADEVALWKGVTIDLMSDEEDGSFEGVSGWIVRPPSYRSQELTDLCATLQARLEASPKYTALHHRRLHKGPYSDRKPPPHDSEVDRHFIPQPSCS